MGSHDSGKKTGGAPKGKPPTAYVPLYTRIKRLRRRAELSIWFWKYVPFAVLFVSTLAIMGTGSVFALYAGAIIAILLFTGLWITQAAAENAYLTTSSYMYQTNLSQLVSDEQFLQQFHNKPISGLASYWHNFTKPTSTIQQLIQNSTHTSLLREYLAGNCPSSSKKVLDSSCLWLSGTVAGQGVLGILPGLAVLSACNLGCYGFLFLPVWIYHYYTILCRQAALMAVCDYFLGTPKIMMHKLNNVGRFFVHSVAMADQPEEVGLLPPGL